MEVFAAELGGIGSCTYLQLCEKAAKLLGAADLSQHGYDHIVIDEAQDLHPSQWRLMRAAVPEGPDDLFITGDPHQRIYESRVSLGSLGISVTGRSSRLRVNYRSTEEILSWSMGVIDGTVFDDLGGDGHDALTGYRSLLHGKRPIAVGHSSEQAEVAALTEQVQAWLDQGIPSREIAVCTRFNLLLDRIDDELAAASIPTVRVKEASDAGNDGVRLASLHAMKGLEFRCVAVAGTTAKAVPFAREVTLADVDPTQHVFDMLRERCLLFVACTRAREALYVSWHGQASPFLPQHAGDY